MEASTNKDQDVASQHDDEAIDHSSKSDNFEQDRHEAVNQPENPERLDHDSLPVNEEEDITHETHIDEEIQILDESDETTTTEAESKIKPQND